MAKKKINIILILFVLGLWGTIGYRTLYRQFSDSKIINATQDQKYNASIKQINKDTFDLEKINRDPFLNKQFQNTVAIQKPPHYTLIKKTTVQTVQKPKSNLSWPTLQYYGYLKSKDRELVLLKIDSKLYKLKLNEPQNGIIVKKKYKDSIEVNFNSETKMILLK
ncbi:hypothetical protein DMB65_09345 [Flavobacterium cheongpyeongense]|uniref:Uncharacterized protein n=1 Tax=Flavobacterium cheongpyeongense TaxID=2212651 RepID=A0A2V4BQ74_9FLAO|nr:hypothetical protein [Flavobacterium cheongpyeongense]PXY41149.1 hypothetical protein DMB65_09345 [Flavobacterium cheongpyeongense]